MTLKDIRNDLNEIRYYYSIKKVIDDASKYTGENSIIEKVEKYNAAILNAPVKLYNVYINLYVLNNTQAALAFEWGLSSDYIKQLNKQLCEFLLKTLEKR